MNEPTQKDAPQTQREDHSAPIVEPSSPSPILAQRTNRFRLTPEIILSIIGVVIAIITLWVQANPHIPITATPESFSTAAPRLIATAEPGEILILVERFDGTTENAEAVRDLVWSAIDDAVMRLHSQQLYDIRVESLGDGVAITSRQEAINLGRRYGASLVVFGSFDSLIGLNVSFAAVSRSLSSHVDGSIDRSISIPMENLGVQIVDVRSFIMTAAAVVYNLNDRPQDALRALGFAHEERDPDSTTWEASVGYAYYLALGLAHYNVGEFAEAIQAYDQALQIEPRSADTLNSRASAEVGLEQYEKAESTYLEVLEINPSFALAQFDLGSLYKYYLIDGRDPQLYFERAIELLTTQIEDDPENVFLLHYRSKAYTEVGNHANALVDAQAASELMPDHSDLTLHLALAYYYAGVYEEALTTLNAIEADFVENATYYDLRANVHLRDSLHEEALRDAQRALELSPDNSNYMFTLAIIHYHLRQYEDALAHLEAAASDLVNNLNYFDWLGATYYQLCRVDDARTTYATYFGLGGDTDVWWMTEINRTPDACPNPSPAPSGGGQ